MPFRRPLPGWLYIDPVSGLVGGTPPPAVHTLQIVVEAQLADGRLLVREAEVDLVNAAVRDIGDGADNRAAIADQ